MPKYELIFEAETTNVTEIIRSPKTPYKIVFECGKCGERTNEIEIHPEEKVEVPNSRGQTNLFCKCRQCNSTNQVDVIEEKAYACEPGTQVVAKLEIRGSHKPVEWCFAEFEARTEGEVYTGDEEIVEWDDTVNDNISVLEVRYTVL